MDIDNDKYNYNTNDHIVKNILVLDSDHRNMQINRNTNSFIIDLEAVNQTPLRDVLGMKLFNFHIYGGTSNLDSKSIYLQINDYNHVIAGNPIIKSAFANFITDSKGVSYRDTSSVDIETDPYTYIFNPVAGNIRKFTISVINSDNTLFDMKDYKLTASLLIYSKRNKHTRK